MVIRPAGLAPMPMSHRGNLWALEADKLGGLPKLSIFSKMKCPRWILRRVPVAKF